jgi:CheY-like chemotaxis protein/anti-sigma regulatory factor (Ser/Thr protein kinase)
MPGPTSPQETPLNEQQQNFLNTIRTSGEALFHLDIDPAIHRSYRGDVNRIRQVLENLLSNAVKFTESGSVTLRVARFNTRGSDANIQFQIIDTGIGIAPEKQNRLFDPFSQADVSTTREYGGTGLGLSISKRLANLMGGDITVASVPGEGSCFSFTLQLTAVTPRLTVRTHSKSISELGELDQGDLMFLVAEDNPVNQKVAIHMLRQLGIEADIVSNGREAIEALAKCQYDIVFMDVQMPEIDGLEASSLIRTSSGHQPYIIAMTANAMIEDREACIAAGMDDFVAKPVRIEDLHAALSLALSKHRKAHEKKHLETAPPDAAKRTRNSDENPYNSSPRA